MKDKDDALVNELSHGLLFGFSKDKIDTVLKVVEQYNERNYEIMLKLSAILDKVNLSLKGIPPELMLHSYHDIPELVDSLVRQHDSKGSEWISVENELPDDDINCRVLVGGVEQRTFHRRFNNKWICMDDRGVYIDSNISNVISHYYLCPSPPEDT